VLTVLRAAVTEPVAVPVAQVLEQAARVTRVAAELLASAESERMVPLAWVPQARVLAVSPALAESVVPAVRRAQPQA
jgi:hypothetical protein